MPNTANMLEKIHSLLTGKGFPIRQKMTATVLFISIVNLIAMSGILFYGMNGLRNIAIMSGNTIGDQSDENSSVLMAEQKKKELMGIASDKAEAIDYRLDDMEKYVRIAASVMQKIHSHPEDILPQTIAPPPASGAGQVIFYMQYGKNVDAAALAHEMKTDANIRDTLIALTECDPIIDSIFVASPKDYILSVDNNLRIAPEDYEAPELNYDALESDWYRLAVEARSIAYTKVREFVFSKELGIFCAFPYYYENGELEGVACIQSTLDSLSTLVNEVNLRNTGFSFVVDERGYVILSSDRGAAESNGELAADLKKDRRVSENKVLSDTVALMVDGGKGITEAVIDGERYFLAYAPIKRTGWSFAAAVAADEIMAPIARNNEIIHQLTGQNILQMDEHMNRTLEASVLLVAALMGIMTIVGKKLSDRVIDPISVLSDGVQEISGGNLNKKINIQTGDEIEHLAECFNGMTDNLKDHMENLARANEEKDRQNSLLIKKNEELSKALHDVERLRISRDNYRTESETDQLTRLYNKAAMETICEKRCLELPDGMEAALFIIDLDHFKEANDTLGHQAGDNIIAGFALQLKLICRAEDAVGRFGGDEFVIMMTGAMTENVIRQKAEAIRHAASSLHIDGRTVGVTASIGVAIAPRHGRDYKTLFQAADKALYNVKEHGRDGFKIGN